ncbi:outer membrane protein assembly factor BamB family protein [Halomarina oriensis]|uniref:PQQ-binding-like beta-propeller repeat protein n=1 Tax=Halomarina oriensis TaxID=671145 RepID=A0A6B0GPY1_9EURY|nr:PQQ-binding-like beta-propeller repeat protein [Halomarina oriensis]MWG36844.1 PQQ-binding-like beta-propeller repeat protein [Halomarina oriensis]
MPSRRTLLAGLGTAGVTALAGCLGSETPSYEPGTETDTDWPMPRYDVEHTGYSPNALGPRESVRERWSVSEWVASGTPAIVDGTVYFPTAESLLALDAETGERVWEYAPESQPWPSSPSVHDGLVYVSAVDEGTVAALDAETGEEVWRDTNTTGVAAPPYLWVGEHVGTPSVVVGGEDGVLAFLDPTTGETVWETDLFGAITTIAYHRTQHYVGTRGGDVYAFTSWGDVSAEHPPTEEWRRRVGGMVEGLLPHDNGVLVSTFGGPLTNLRVGANAGTTDWTMGKGGARTIPTNAGGTVVAGGYDELTAFRASDERTHWTADGDYGGVPPVAAGDTVYASAGDTVRAFALDSEGGLLGGGAAERWSFETHEGSDVGLAVADGALFVSCQDTQGDGTTLFCLESA